MGLKWICRMSLLLVLFGFSTLVSACGGEEEAADVSPTSPPLPTSPQPTATATAPATASPAVDAPASPSNLQISGALPDLSTPVPPGQGELGRISVSWEDNSDDEEGFRIYQDCGGEISELLEVPADTTSHGPLQSCRPGRIGVAAFNSSGMSATVWSQ